MYVCLYAHKYVYSRTPAHTYAHEHIMFYIPVYRCNRLNVFFSIYMHVYVCVCVCIYAHKYVYSRAPAHTYTHKHIMFYIPVYRCSRLNIFASIYMHIYIYVCVCVCVCVLYVCIYAHKPAHIHTQKYYLSTCVID